MRVLGIDPGSHNTGWGVVEGKGNALVHVASGTIRGGTGDALCQRLCAIADGLEGVLRRYGPQAVSVERVFSGQKKSALMLAQARGVALLCAARFGAAVFEYTASQVKQAATGRGMADKAQVQQMVQVLLGLHGRRGFDTTDALAVAICHVAVASSAAARLIAGDDGSR